MASHQAICSVAGCGKTVKSSKDFCHAHYMRFKRHGDPLGGRTGKGVAAKYFEDVVLGYDGEECLIWPYGGERYAKLKMNGKHVLVHRYLCQLVHGDPPTLAHEAAHNCGVSQCVNRWHIEWKTTAGNQADRLIHGTDMRGEKSPNAKVTADQVREIRRLNGSLPQYEIAARFGVSQAAINSIVLRKSWRHIE